MLNESNTICFLIILLLQISYAQAQSSFDSEALNYVREIFPDEEQKRKLFAEKSLEEIQNRPSWYNSSTNSFDKNYNEVILRDSTYKFSIIKSFVTNGYYYCIIKSGQPSFAFGELNGLNPKLQFVAKNNNGDFNHLDLRYFFDSNSYFFNIKEFVNINHDYFHGTGSLIVLLQLVLGGDSDYSDNILYIISIGDSLILHYMDELSEIKFEKTEQKIKYITANYLIDLNEPGPPRFEALVIPLKFYFEKNKLKYQIMLSTSDLQTLQEEYKRQKEELKTSSFLDDWEKWWLNKWDKKLEKYINANK